jgi:hypothetical protein
MLTLKSDSEDLRSCGQIRDTYSGQEFSIPQEAACHICPHEKCEITRRYEAWSKTSLTCYAQPVPDRCLRYCSRGEIPSSNVYESNCCREIHADKSVSVYDIKNAADLKNLNMEWFKTADNCYISGAIVQNYYLANPSGGSLFLSPNPRLESCGPVPYLEMAFRSTSRRPVLTPVVPSLVVQGQTIILPARPTLCPSCPPLISTFRPLPTPTPVSSTVPNEATNSPKLGQNSLAKPPIPGALSQFTASNPAIPSLQLPPIPGASTAGTPLSTTSNSGPKLPPRPNPNQGNTKGVALTTSPAQLTLSTLASPPTIPNPTAAGALIEPPPGSIPKLVTSHLTIPSSSGPTLAPRPRPSNSQSANRAPGTAKDVNTGITKASAAASSPVESKSLTAATSSHITGPSYNLPPPPKPMKTGV